MARIPAETTRTLLVVGSLTVAGVGLLKNAYWKENSDGTWFFQDIVALSCETESKIMLEDLGERVAWFRNLPAVGQDNYVEILADLFAKIRERIEGVTHVVFTGKWVSFLTTGNELADTMQTFTLYLGKANAHKPYYASASINATTSSTVSQSSAQIAKHSKLFPYSSSLKSIRMAKRHLSKV